jgi:hypothetical protein
MFSENWLLDGCEVVRLTHQPPFTRRKILGTIGRGPVYGENLTKYGDFLGRMRSFLKVKTGGTSPVMIVLQKN